MKLSDIKDGMKLKGVGDYADGCIKVGGLYVAQTGTDGVLEIICGCGVTHKLDSTADEAGEIPELEPLA
jgi:hypothetical protein